MTRLWHIESLFKFSSNIERLVLPVYAFSAFLAFFWFSKSADEHVTFGSTGRDPMHRFVKTFSQPPTGSFFNKLSNRLDFQKCPGNRIQAQKKQRKAAKPNIHRNKPGVATLWLNDRRRTLPTCTLHQFVDNARVIICCCIRF
jgi:hypothetical protein